MALSQQQDADTVQWRVDGSANFNGLIRLCIKEVKGFCIRFLCGNNNVAAMENKFDLKPFDVKDKEKQKWTRLRPKVKFYLEVIVQVSNLFTCLKKLYILKQLKLTIFQNILPSCLSA